jgi:1,4-alpha-glucan branching enzyme
MPTTSEIELGLFAPYNETVELIGSWNDWKPQPLQRQEDGWWRTKVPLAEGDYRYKFRVKSNSYFCRGEMKEIFDPYGMSVSDDEQEASIIKIENGRQNEYSYVWKNDHVPLPTNDKLVIYEMHIGDFTRGLGKQLGPRQWEKGHFADAIEKLDYLKDLGINCIELMPVKEFPGVSWGYNLRSLFAIENTYGPAADLARFIDECHGRGIRVVMDGVYNHADKDAPLAQIDYDYWFYNPNPDPPEMQWGPKYNYLKYDEKHGVFPARKYVIDSIRRMVDWFHIDGIRFDATKAIGNFDVLRELAEAGLKKVEGMKPFINICEHIAEDPAVTGYPHAGPMHSAWHESLAKRLQAVVAGTKIDWADPDLGSLIKEMNPATNEYKSGRRTINYASSHDQLRLIRTITDHGKITDEAAFRRMKLAAAIVLTIPGIPMIWMGQEFAMANDKDHASATPLDWSLLEQPLNADLQKFTANLVKLRLSTPVLMNDSFEACMIDQERQLLAYKRWNDVGGLVVVMLNLREQPANDVTVANCGLPDGAWREQISGSDLQVKDGVIRANLGPSEVKIFVKQ